MLFPAALLVLLAMVTITVDAAVVHLGQRRLSDIAAAMANDAVATLDKDQYYATGDIAFDPERAVARLSAIADGLATDRELYGVRCEVLPSGARATVACTGQIRPLFSRLWADVTDRVTVTARETARAAEQ